jgi:phage terminase large subunit-like protein
MDRRRFLVPGTCNCGHPPLIETPPPRVRGAYFDVEEALRVVDALGQLTHTKGRWARTALEPDPWQIEHVIGPIFGWRHRSSKLRIRRTGWIELPRKNGKSTISSGIALVLLAADGELGAEVYSAAGSKEQARIVHEPAKQMIRWSPALAGKLTILADVITAPTTGGIYRVVSSIAELAHGLNVSGAVIDEVHVHKNRALIDALETGTGAREQPLVILITTPDEGDEFSIYAEKHTYTREVASGSIIDATHFGAIWAATEADEPFSRDTWKRANPGYGVTIHADYLEKEAKKAKASPSYLPTFKRLHLGLRERSVAKFLKLHEWDRAAGRWADEDWAGLPAWGGLDLSTNTDLTAFALVAPLRPERDPDADGDDVEAWLAETLVWIPEESLDDVERQTNAPLARWVREGWLHVTEGNVVDYRQVRRDAVARVQALGVRLVECGFDPFAAMESVQYLQDEGWNMVQIRQTYLGLNAATKGLERLVKASTLKRPLFRHRGHPVLRWMADCVDVARDPSDNIKPVKPDRYRSSKRIDGIAAHVNALARALLRETPRRSVYEDRGMESA